jgi:CYTH domain-containing protein
LSKSNARRVEKIRYSGLIDGRPVEVDVFAGALQGLVLIDFEFPDPQQLRQFVMPEICLADVTQETFLAGGMLAGKSLADIMGSLSDFGYAPIVAHHDRNATITS